MKPLPTEGYSGLYFTTATIKGWKHLLKPDNYKMIVTDAMTFLAERQEVWFYALSSACFKQHQLHEEIHTAIRRINARLFHCHGPNPKRHFYKRPEYLVQTP